MGDENPIRTLGDYSKPSHEGYRNTIELPDPNQHLKDFLKLVDSLDLDGENRERMHIKDLLKLVDSLDLDASGKLRGLNAEESWALLEDLALYDNKSWNDLRDFAKPVKAITMPQDVPGTSDHRLIKLKNQVQHLMEAHFTSTQPSQVNKVTTSCEICSGPHDTQYFMEIHKHSVEYASTRNHEAGELFARSYPTIDPQCSTQIHSSINGITIHPKQQSNSHNDRTEENEEEEKDSLENTHSDSSTSPNPSISFITEKVLKFIHELKVISAFVDSRLESIKQFLNNFNDQPNETNMNNLETDDESGETPFVSPFPHSDNDSDDEEVLKELCEYENVGMLRQEKAINSFNGDDLAFECMIGFRKSTAYFDPFLPMNIITRKAYNTIMVKGLESTRKNLVAIVRDVYVFVGSFTYTTDFVVLENIGEFIQINEVEVVVGPEYQVDKSMKEWLIRGHVIFDEKKLESS
ncbi:hypothetical protein Tco_0724965 [Tanacetum coccineum]|uniref:MAK10-like protein n=1 Tax=Tanacetum coccineum TaxID=301880 RepID=A0ABQ4YBJ1_9ASTR